MDEDKSSGFSRFRAVFLLVFPDFLLNRWGTGDRRGGRTTKLVLFISRDFSCDFELWH